MFFKRIDLVNFCPNTSVPARQTHNGSIDRLVPDTATGQE